MKKVFLLFVVLSMLFFSGCSSFSEGFKDGMDSVLNKDDLTDSTVVDEGEVLDDDIEQEEVAQETEPDPTPGVIEIEEQVVYDDHGIVITTKSLEKDQLNLFIENNSELDVTVQAREISVNGCMVSVIFSSDVAAGKKANDKIRLSSSNMSEAGIEEIANIQLSFHIYSGRDTIDDSAQIDINTNSQLVQTFDDTGVEVFNQDGIRIVSRGIAFKAGSKAEALLFIENTSGQSITVQTRDESINGLMISGIMSSDVKDGCVAYSSISFFSSNLEDNGIAEIEEIEFTFHIYSSENRDFKLDSDVIRISE